ncbi:MAG: hypothetical protein V2A69_01585 [Pseudomonadota bacterium]
METIEPKILAAISGAIKAYREEEMLMESREEVIPPPGPIERVNLWAIAGRQDIMLQRKLWQLRLY